MLSDHGLVMPGYDYCIFYSSINTILEQMINQWFIKNLDQGFRHAICNGRQPRTLSGSNKNYFQLISFRNNPGQDA